MIRFSTALVVAALAVLAAGVATSRLTLVYVAVGISAVSLVCFAIGVFLKRGELFGAVQSADRFASASGAPLVTGRSSGPAGGGSGGGGSGGGEDRFRQAPRPSGRPASQHAGFTRPAAGPEPASAGFGHPGQGGRHSAPSRRGTGPGPGPGPERPAPPDRPTGPERPTERPAGPERREPAPMSAEWSPAPERPASDWRQPPPRRPETGPQEWPQTAASADSSFGAGHASSPRPEPPRSEAPRVRPWVDQPSTWPPRPEPPRPEAPRAEPPRPEPSRSEPPRSEPQRPEPARPAGNIPPPVAPIFPDRGRPKDQEEPPRPAREPEESSSWFAGPPAPSEPQDFGDEAPAPAMLAGELVRDDEDDADDDVGDVTPSLATIAAAEALLNQPPSPLPSSSLDSEVEPEETGVDEGPGDDVSVSPDTEVSVVPGVPRYHRPDCILIRFMGAEDLESKTIQDAADSGCTPCRACQPEVDSPPE